MVIVEEDQFNRAFPARRLARVTLFAKDGQCYQSEVTEARGDPEAPLDSDEIARKFHHLAAPLLGAGRASQVETQVQKLGSGENLKALIDNITSDIT
jgi:2-methylcitrate dehydratase PrpD